jgi:hypothetical protein
MLKQLKSKILKQFPIFSRPFGNTAVESEFGNAIYANQKQKFEYFGRGGKNLFLLLRTRTKECSVLFTCGARSIVDLIYKTEAFLWLDSSNLHICACFSAEGYYSK